LDVFFDGPAGDALQLRCGVSAVKKGDPEEVEPLSDWASHRKTIGKPIGKWRFTLW